MIRTIYKYTLIITISFSLSIGISSFINAETTLNSNLDIIIINTPEYKKHTKGLVIFNHKKHFTEYGNMCEKCHHDNNGSPLNKNNVNQIKKCVNCHSYTGKKIKNEKLTKKEAILKYHKKAFHTSCKACHKKHNKTNNLKKGDLGMAPTDCIGCHPKK